MVHSLTMHTKLFRGEACCPGVRRGWAKIYPYFTLLDLSVNEEIGLWVRLDSSVCSQRPHKPFSSESLDVAPIQDRPA